MEKIHEYFEKYKDKYTSFRPLLRDIKRIEYADDEKYSILPCYFERGFKRKGKEVNKDEAAYDYGFDKKDRLIYISDENSETFLTYSRDGKTLYCFCDDSEIPGEKTLRYIQIPLLNKGLPVVTIQVDKWQNSYIEKYHFENKRIVKIENPILFGFGTFNDVLEIEYDPYGNISKITDKASWLPNGLVYKRISKTEAEELERKIIGEISGNIIKKVIENYKKDTEKLCYISLEIHEEYHTVLSSIYARLAYESDRDKYVSQKGEQYKKEIWDYSNKSIEFYDNQLEMECNILVQYFLSNSDCFEESDRIVEAIVERLRAYKWSEYITVSDEFEILEPLKYD